MGLLRDSSQFSRVPFSICSYKYDVFLSFRGKDTRENFAGHLYRYLSRAGIKTFIDDDLTRGEEISQALVRVIEDSKLSLIVFSENYASSKWCLDELVLILECKRLKNQKVHPIFYKVNPSDVRHQRGKFGEAFAELESRFKDGRNKVLCWRAALSEAATLSGWPFLGGYEYIFIERIVEEVSAQVKEPTYVVLPERQIGIDSRIEDMFELLDAGRSSVCMVGICGSGGIGKTTIAKAVYSAIADRFDCCCFLADVRTNSEQHGGMVNLQNIILSSIAGHKELKINDVNEGSTLLSQRLKDKRFLLVLDDVDSLDQLKKIAGRTYWYGHGSRVIITTRDEHVLIARQNCHIYKALELDSDEARELFCAHASVDSENLDINENIIVSTVVEYAQGNPLALKVLGSYLCDTSIIKWPNMLDGSKQDPPKCIQDILMISYDGLRDMVKEVFLDIACFFQGWKKNDVMQKLKDCGHINAEYSIKVLEEKALISVDRYDCICMHDLLEEMGKKIVEQESTDAGKRSRVWYHKDVRDILTKNTGTSKVFSIMVKMPTADEIELSPKCFKKMTNLKMFININGRFVGGVDYLPEQLRVLDWPDCPFQYWPSYVNMSKLVQLNVRGSHISHLREFNMQNMMSLNLGESEFLTQVGDLSGIPNLQYLNLSGCSSLEEIHPSVGSLEKLVLLDLVDCSNLVSLPKQVKWRSLQTLLLDNCTSLESFPEIVEEMEYITSFRLYHTGIKALPSSIQCLVNLEELSLVRCGNLTDLPSSVYRFPKLKRLYLSECPKLVLPTHSNDDFDTSLDPDSLVLPWLDDLSAIECNISNMDFMASLDCAFTLHSLNLSGSHVFILPECIKEFVNLKTLDLSHCRRLLKIPELPPRIAKLDLMNCVSLQSISKLSNILEHKESQMIDWMDLTNCWTLCQNLVEMANEENDEVISDLFSRLLSSQKSNFIVTFPVPRCQIPDWFSCQMDIQGHDWSEVWIETLENFKWDNNTGLALCVAVDHSLHDTDPVFFFDVFIHINEVNVLHLPSQCVDSEGSDHVWVHYVPFSELWRFGYRRPLPPFTCRVVILPCPDSEASIRSCGVHLVMPPNEDVCMKLIPAENRTSYAHSVDEIYKEENWEIYCPKQRTDCKELYADAQPENQKL